MNAQTESRLIDGPAGAIELAIDRPEGAVRATAVIAHPHPLHGGTLTNKVVQTVARAAVLAGMVSVRFNFRGVGRSGGQYDEGTGNGRQETVQTRGGSCCLLFRVPCSPAR